MNKKVARGISLGVFGSCSIVIAGLTQELFGSFIANIFGISGFVLLVIAVVYLIMNFPDIVTSELNKREAELEAEKDFFQYVRVQENTASLEGKFIKAGLRPKYNYLYKRKFSLLHDYMNLYAIIVKKEDLGYYLNTFIENIDIFLETSKPLHRNNYVYIVFFQKEISDEQLAILRSLYISQDVIQEIPNSVSYTIIPAIYNTDTEEYILRRCTMKHSLKPINHANCLFWKIVF